MDSEHRHELKTNELADWLGHLPDFLHNNAKTIIGVVLIIAAAIVFFYSRRTAADSRLNEQAQATMQIEEMDISYELLRLVKRALFKDSLKTDLLQIIN